MGSVPMRLTICEMLTREHNNVTRAEWSTGARVLRCRRRDSPVGVSLLDEYRWSRSEQEQAPIYVICLQKNTEIRVGVMDV